MRIKRYKMPYMCSVDMQKDPDGEWVRWEDVKKALGFSNRGKKWSDEEESDPVGDIWEGIIKFYPCRLSEKLWNKYKATISTVDDLNCMCCEFRESCNHILKRFSKTLKEEEERE